MRAAIAMFIMVLVLATTVNAFTASIQPPRMVLRGNVSDTLTVFVDARNPNEFPVTVNVTLEDLPNVVILDDSQFFELTANETRRVIFDVEITRAGTQSGEAQFIFFPVEKIEGLDRGLALAAQMVVIGEGSEEPEPTTTTTEPSPEIPSSDFINLILIVGTIITAVLLFMFFRR